MIRRPLWAAVALGLAIATTLLGQTPYAQGLHAGTTLYYIFWLPFIRSEDEELEIMLVQVVNTIGMALDVWQQVAPREAEPRSLCSGYRTLGHRALGYPRLGSS